MVCDLLRAQMQSTAIENQTKTWARIERFCIGCLCLLAALHVFIYSAAFPFFNNVDEGAHFDLVVKYSHGEFPRRMDFLSDESLHYIAIFSTYEYFATESDFPGWKMPTPIWRLPPDVAAPALRYREAGWRNLNHEASQPPLYYLLAGSWWRLENLAGLEGGDRLYGVRFFNVIFIVALVWFGACVARLVFPENIFIRLGVPALLAFFPQTAFYGIGNDVLSPVAFGIAFLFLIKFFKAERPDVKLGMLTGLALAATFLVKLSDLPLVAVTMAAMACMAVRHLRAGSLRTFLPALAAFSAAAILPMAAWLAWCKCNFGDFTGSAAKVHFLGWTKQPIAEWWHHPIFTPQGFWFFLEQNQATFWRGEFLWHHAPLAISAVDAVYVTLTLGVLGFVLIALLRKLPAFTSQQRSILWFCFACIPALLAFYALLSVQYDFHDCVNPSRALPFFVSGRLLLGMLIPFVLLFICGLDQLLKIARSRTKFFVLTGLLGFMIAAETLINGRVFPSPYNWFHM